MITPGAVGVGEIKITIQALGYLFVVRKLFSIVRRY